MLRFTAALPVAMAAVVLLGGFQSAPPPPIPLPPAIAALAEDATAARAYDYMALKAEGAPLTPLSHAIFRRSVIAGSDPRCLTEAEAEVQMGLAAAEAAADRATFDDDRAAAADAWAKWTVFAEGIEHGQQATEQPFKWVSDRYAQLDSETSPRARELLGRAARDQLYRHAFSGGSQIWGELSPGAQGRVNTALERATCAIDGENTAWLKADVAANGWFTVSATGAQASSAAWLMAQHADRDRPFQKQVLALMEPLVATGEVSRANYAYLWDRIAVSENRPQRYGTQGRCTAPGRWEPNEIEDMSRVEALREEAAIGTLVEYQAHMHPHCANFTG